MVELFFCENGALNCSIVGATFCRALDVLEDILLLIEGLKNGVDVRFDFAHVEHIQLVFLLPRLREIRGTIFIVRVGLDCQLKLDVSN